MNSIAACAFLCIINSPHKVPALHWNYIRETKDWELKEGRRQAGYLIANPRAGHDDPGEFVPIKLVNVIRPRVDSWRENNYPGILYLKQPSGQAMVVLPITTATNSRLYFFKKQLATVFCL